MRVFLTGGSGFIGRSIVPRLADAGHDVTVLTRRPEQVRFPRSAGGIRIIKGSLDNAESYVHELSRIEVVIHAATSNASNRRLGAERDVAAIAALLAGARRFGVRRFVHLSSISVYGVTPDGPVDELTPAGACSDPYALGKMRAEQEVIEHSAMMETVVLRLANVYGPGPCWWSGAISEMMKRGKILLVNGGNGTANLVHVEDAAQAICLAAAAGAAAGETFIVSGGHPITWRQYFEALEGLIGRKATLDVSLEEAKALSARLQDRALVARARRWISRRVLGDPLVFPMQEESIDKFASRPDFSIDKAVKVLGYRPRYDLSRGIATLSS